MTSQNPLTTEAEILARATGARRVTVIHERRTASGDLVTEGIATSGDRTAARYRATILATGHHMVRDDAHAAFVSTIDAHCPVEFSTWNPTGAPEVFRLSATFQAASDTEAAAIVEDAGKATGLPFDSASITPA